MKALIPYSFSNLLAHEMIKEQEAMVAGVEEDVDPLSCREGKGLKIANARTIKVVLMTGAVGV